MECCRLGVCSVTLGEFGLCVDLFVEKGSLQSLSRLQKQLNPYLIILL